MVSQFSSHKLENKMARRVKLPTEKIPNLSNLISAMHLITSTATLGKYVRNPFMDILDLLAPNFGTYL